MARPTREEAVGWTVGGILAALCCLCLCGIAIAGLIVGSIALANSNNNGGSTSTSNGGETCPCVNNVVVFDPLFIENVSAVKKHHQKFFTLNAPKHVPKSGLVGLPMAVSGGALSGLYQKTGSVATLTIPSVNYTSDVGVCAVIIPLSQFPSILIPVSNPVPYGEDPFQFQTALSYTNPWEVYIISTNPDTNSALYITAKDQCTGLNFTTPTVTLTYMTTTSSASALVLGLGLVLAALFA